jgi:squalene synthase HpnC
VGVGHYENFPVASLLCPAAIRPAVVAIYRFARTADDIADEGDAPAQQRLDDLQAFRAELDAIYAGRAPSPRWADVFGPLDAARRAHGLPQAPLAALLDAFTQDTRNLLYADRTQLLDYCSRSANPVGRLMLHLYGIGGADAEVQSDAICSALQLVNFWQDLSVDLPRGRVYLPLEDARRHGVDLARPQALADSAATRGLVADVCRWSGELMRRGAPLVHRLPGRAGWELRLVVQGGWRVLETIGRMDFATVGRRPTLGAADFALLAWRALLMRPPAIARADA